MPRFFKSGNGVFEAASSFMDLVGVGGGDGQDERFFAIGPQGKFIRQGLHRSLVGPERPAVIGIDPELKELPGLGVARKIMPALLFESFNILAKVEFSGAFSNVSDGKCVCAYRELFGGQIDRAVPALIRDLLKSSSVSDYYHGHRCYAQKDNYSGDGKAPDKRIPSRRGWPRSLKWRRCYGHSRLQNGIESLPRRHAFAPNKVVACQLPGLPTAAQFFQRENSDGLPVLMQMIIHKKTTFVAR